MENTSWSSMCMGLNTSTSYPKHSFLWYQNLIIYQRLWETKPKLICTCSLNIHTLPKGTANKKDLQKGFPQSVTSAEKHEGLHAS